MAWIERHGDGGTQIDITQAQNQIARGEHDVAHVLDRPQPVDATDELDVVGAPGRIGAYRAHVALNGLGNRRVVEGQGQPYRARGDFEAIEIAYPVLQVSERAQQTVERQHVRVVVDLQGANAWRHINDTGRSNLLELHHERMYPQAQSQVEYDGAVLDEHVSIALASVEGLGARLMRVEGREDRVRVAQSRGAASRPCRGTVGPGDTRILRAFRFSRTRFMHALKLQSVAGSELPELPEVCGDDDEWADEAAERGAIGTQDDGHIARKVDCPHGVSVIVNVGWVQPRFAPVAPGPLWLGADEAHTGAIGVVMHLPGRAQDGVDVGTREEVRRPVRPI